jgi:phage shock protein C
VAEKRLYRSCKNKVFGGVAAGLAEYFDFDPSPVRLIFLLIAVTTGFGVLLYLAAWAIIPIDPTCDTKKTGSEEIKEQAEKVASDIRKAANGSALRKNDVMSWIGLIIVALGLLFLAQNILGVHLMRVFWPVLLVVVGAMILANSINRK